MSDDFAAHLTALFACRACPTVAGTPVTGPIDGARVMLVGQAPGPREESFGKPFAYTAGRRLFQWFNDALGVPEEAFRARVYIAAVIRCFPGRDPKGGDRVPSSDEIFRCAVHLDRELRMVRPGLVIAVGTLAAKQLLGRSELREVVGRVHFVARAGHEFEVVVLPHPSGRSTWTNRPENRALLAESLRLIGERFSGVSPLTPDPSPRKRGEGNTESSSEAGALKKGRRSQGNTETLE